MASSPGSHSVEIIDFSPLPREATPPTPTPTTHQDLQQATDIDMDILSSPTLASLAPSRPPPNGISISKNSKFSLPPGKQGINFDFSSHLTTSHMTRHKRPRIEPQPLNNTTMNTQHSLAKTKILEARDLILEACSLTQSHTEKSCLLDLLEIFREYTEKGKLHQNASTIIASQVANLESATKKMENRARTLTATHAITPTVQPPSFATTAAINAPGSAQPQEWTLVGKKPNKPKAAPPVKIKPARSDRLILIKSPTAINQDFSPLALRNSFNQAFAARGVQGPVVTTVSKSLSQNIIVTTTSPFSAQFLLDQQSIWEHLLPFKSAQLDEPWHKVVLHGLPTADFNTPYGMDLVVDEIKTFNKGLNPIGTPYWLTPEEKRLNQRAGSVAVAFGTEEEANRAIRNRLYIAGMSVRVEKLYSTSPTTQCQKCQGFGHLNSYCRRSPSCKLCGENHATQQHVCNTCQAKGRKCIHLVPKCANCREAHTADHRLCEVLIGIKNKALSSVHDL
jgi:hypothetical protein